MAKILSALCVGGLALLAGSVSAPVSAQDLELQIGPDGVRPRIVDPDEESRYSRRGRCDLDEARDVARDEGLRRPRVVDVTERRVVVRGRTADGPETIVLANRRGCPVIG
jgi:hypothetical protein